MSSIKRDVKKKVLPRPEARFFLEIQPTEVSFLWRSSADDAFGLRNLVEESNNAHPSPMNEKTTEWESHSVVLAARA
jgi:hypothetical protein